MSSGGFYDLTWVLVSCQSFPFLWIVVSDLYGLRYTTLDNASLHVPPSCYTLFLFFSIIFLIFTPISLFFAP